MRIIQGGLDDERVIQLLRLHVARAHLESARDSCHALDVDGLAAPTITFWSAWEDDTAGATLAGVGALKELGPGHGEVKSMHTVEALRGRGVGSALLRHIIATARTRGMTRLSLETGAGPYFAPARALYERHEFVECPPFSDYRAGPDSVFMTLVLSPTRA